MPLVTGGSSLFPGCLGIADGRPCSSPLYIARTVSLISLPGLLVSKTPVISSQAPHHRLHNHAPRGPFHGPLVAVCMKPCGSRECPREGHGPKGIHHDHCLSRGRGGSRPTRARSEGGSSAPLEVTRGWGSGKTISSQGAAIKREGTTGLNGVVHSSDSHRSTRSWQSGSGR